MRRFACFELDLAQQKRDKTVPERIVHYAVQLVPLKIFTKLSVSFFTGCIFPDFSDQDGVRFFFDDGFFSVPV